MISRNRRIYGMARLGRGWGSKGQKRGVCALQFFFAHGYGYFFFSIK